MAYGLHRCVVVAGVVNQLSCFWAMGTWKSRANLKRTHAIEAIFVAKTGVALEAPSTHVSQALQNSAEPDFSQPSSYKRERL